MKKDFGKTLRGLREAHGFTRENVAELLTSMGTPVNARHVQRWEWGRNYPTIEQFLSLCKLYCVKDVCKVFFDKKYAGLFGKGRLNAEGVKKLAEYAELLIDSGRYCGQPRCGENKGPGEVIKLPTRKIPLYDNVVSAGLGADVDTEECQMIAAPKGLPDDAAFAVRVFGDSMTPTLKDGQIIYVNPTGCIGHGDIGVFFLNGSVYVKEYRYANGRPLLYSHNQNYAPMDISGHEDFKSFGKVVYPKPSEKPKH